MIKYIPRVFMIILVLLQVACFSTSSDQTNQSQDDNLMGQILVWHSWEGEERAVLNGLFDDFMELYPDVTIIEEFYPAADIQQVFTYQVGAGLGPDIVIAPATWAKPLAQQGLIQDINNQEIDLDVYLTTAIDMLRDEENMYGLPLSLNTFVLYYNKALLGEAQTPTISTDTVAELIETKQATITDTETLTTLDELLTEVQQSETISDQLTPPDTLDDLLDQANKGQRTAIRTDFYGAFWGVQTFGGQLFDEESRVVLNQGGFANWLEWLKRAQDNPNVILNRNPDELTTLFTNGQVTYYVGNTQELPALKEALGPENVGVIRLPSRQGKFAGPFLQAEGIMFNKVSAPENLQLSLNLARYLTNTEQQRKLALSLAKLPANRRVRIDPRVSPLVAEFIAQSRTAVPISLANIGKFNDVLAASSDLYNQVLDGQTNVGEAATALTQEINEKYGLETLGLSQLEDCDVAGRITVWNTWTGARSETLRQIQDNFMAACPAAFITIVDVDPADFNDQYIASIEADDAPHMFIGNDQHIRLLAPQELILNVSNLLDAESLQRFIPLVEQSTAYEGSSYAIPVNLNVMALYYNTSLVSDPPAVLDDLLIAATPDTAAAIPIGFEESFWGISAFGESSVNNFLSEEKRLVLGETGLTAWLDWLKEAQSHPGIVLNTDLATLQTLFIEEKAAFLVGDVSQLEPLQTALGADKIGVVPLPTGSPLLRVDAIFLNPFTTPEEQAVAMQFGLFMTNVESQQRLLENGRIPVNINVSTTDYPAIASFIEQANNATLIPNQPEIRAVFEWGDLVYEQVLENDFEPTDAVRDFTNLVDTTNGFETIEVATIEDCTEEGELSLWHSWTEGEALAWQGVISDFVQSCPNVQVTTTFVSVQEFTQQLTSTQEIDSELAPPHLFLTSQTNLETYQTNQLIKNITGLVDEDILVNYLPRSVSALSIGEELYGLPQNLRVLALYYNPNLVTEPAHTFDGLLLQAQEGITIGFSSYFYGIFWGASAFGCQPCQSGEFFDEAGELVLSRADLAEWVTWLETAQETGNVTFSANQTTLETRFLEGNLAYLVAGPEFLNQAQTALGVANVAVTTLPVGAEEQVSRSFLQVSGFYFHANMTEAQTDIALKFARFATAEVNQTALIQTANYIPSNNLALVKADNPTIGSFITQVENSLLLFKPSRITLLEEAPVFETFASLSEPENSQESSSENTSESASETNPESSSESGE